jgi:hypothetical protein
MQELAISRDEHPLDLVERIATQQQWSFDRDGADEIQIGVAGAWADYSVAFTWLDDLEALHIACSFPFKATETRRTELQRLIAKANEQLWLGHFDVWPDENAIMFRHSLLLFGGVAPSASQCERVLQIAVETCEKYYQAFQLVVWAGQSADEALQTAMFATIGRA